MNPALRIPAEFVAPSTEDAHLPPFFEVGSFAFGKQSLLILLSVVIIAGFFLFVIRRRAMVPSKGQFLGEMGYGFVRNHLGRDIIGEKDFRPYVPLLFTFFFFILVNNLFGSILVLQLPTFAHPGSAYVVAAIAYVVWVFVGIKRHGFGQFMVKMTMPPNVPKILYVILIPLEFLSNLIIRPVTHALRVFATMFAGHMAIMVAAALTAFLATQVGGVLGIGGSIFGIILGLFIYFLEVLIQVLQAYIFTLLFAVYVQGALQEGH
ncbi:ATP synthase subunit a [Kocuria varians]|uniref:ATP synthase subunit a n=1 Tax=Kocuria varians TaxID=1272 RepID=A0A4Y4D2I3_KOCVA|nr:F0F1 ATP synthase subunit A [Kocuria varians]GEC99405.1 ATP synthase subunit a [Kocuria varians]